jgi:Protein of unknown function (DUF3071)
MRPVRFVALSEDGHALVLTDEVGRLLALPIDERVHYALIPESERPRGSAPIGTGHEQTATLAPRDIQARIRSGESAEDVARVAGVPVDRVLRYAGPVLQERAMLAQYARRTKLRTSDRGASLAEVVDARLAQHGIDTEKISWDASRREDGTWRVVATWPSGKATAQAMWELDKARQLVTPFDDMAQYLCADRAAQPSPDLPDRQVHGHGHGHGLGGPLRGESSRGELGRGDFGRGDHGRGELGRADLNRGDLNRGDPGRGDLGRGANEPARPGLEPPRREPQRLGEPPQRSSRPANDPIRAGRDALLASLDRPLGTNPRSEQSPAGPGTPAAAKASEPQGRPARGAGAAGLIGASAGSAFDEPGEPVKEVPSVPSLAVLRPRRTATPEVSDKPRKRLPSWDDVLFGGGPARESG